MESARHSSLLTSGRFLVTTLVCITCVKVLCMPAYRSTDFDVHRNWLAITKHLPLSEWYFHNGNNTTVHTLDYPPAFAFFEYALSNNFITQWLLENAVLDGKCLALLPDSDNAPSLACVVFQRSTVILSDVILWIGAFAASHAIVKQRRKATITFLLIVLNPSFLYLDHIHFQYNGMLLGLLLLSIAFMAKALQEDIGIYLHVYYLLGAFFYATLLTMKHLYLPLAPLYLITILQRYCFIGQRFSFQRFALVALVTGSTLLLPFLPFLLDNPKDQMLQMLSRLFPFGRGLVHDYWAANVWALYVFAERCIGFVCRKLRVPLQVPKIPPSVAALSLLLALIPALVSTCQQAKQSTINTSRNFVRGIVFCSFSAFMLAYHVHEKAIMTVIVPMTLLATLDDKHARLFFRVCALGHFGLLPLLFRPVELPMKIIAYAAFMAFAQYTLEITLTWTDQAGITVLVFVTLFVEVIHPLIFQSLGLMEFLPLMITSIVCALGLVACWVQSGTLLFRSEILKSRKRISQ